MKIWLKYLIGAALGIALSFALSQNSDAAKNIISFCAAVVVRIGRYMVIPLVFTGCASAVFVLRDSKKLIKSTAAVFAAIAASSAMLTVFGTISVLAVKLPRIPISVERIAGAPTLGAKAAVESLFPYSAFESLMDGSCLLPAFVFACLIGAACVSDKAKTKPIIALIDSLSNIFYYIASFIMDIMSVGMIAIAFIWARDFGSMLSLGILTPLILLLTADFLILVCILYPLIFFFICKGHHPFRLLYASLAPMLASFFSGDANYTLPFYIRHGTESLGIRRRINGFSFPLFSIFARGGASLVVSVSFIVILRSYSPLAIPAEDIFWIMGVSFGLSFLLCAHSSGGAYIALAVLCTMYGRGFETVYLLLKPAAVIICAYAAVIDAATVMFGSYLVSFKLKMTEHRDLRHFI
jgi:Na+/H+-dicarboxylate symporter